MDMTIDINAVNFVEHAELLDVILTKMQPGHILYVDVVDTEYAFLKTNDELFYINIDNHIPPYTKQDVIAFINGNNPYDETASRADITAPQTIDDNIDEYNKILERLNSAKDLVRIPTTPFIKHGNIFLNIAHNFKPTLAFEVVLYLLEQKKQVEATSRTTKKKSRKKK